MKPILLCVAFFTLVVPFVLAEEKAPDTQPAKESWGTSLKEAIKEAKAANRPILVDFTGSNWCPPCKALTKQVLDTPEFIQWASDKVVLLKADFPRGKEQDAETKKQNAELAKKYQIRGFPTVMLISAKGKEFSRHVGYNGNPEPWKKELEANLGKVK
jgi:thiol:disulfide interchange protein